MDDTVIRVNHFSKSYGDFVAVDDITFQVQRGEIFGLLGPNGAGKSSTLECLEGLRQPNGGTLDILGVCKKVTTVPFKPPAPADYERARAVLAELT